jgi:hypothetical protein
MTKEPLDKSSKNPLPSRGGESISKTFARGSKYISIALASGMLLTAPALAAYTQPASTFSAGGGESSSTGFTNLGVIGQPGIVGSSTGGVGGHSANHGFLSVLGDGLKILYPVIAIDKGSITFTLASNSSGSDTIAISNSGGSTLNWSIAKNSGSNWLTMTPPSGSAPLSVAIRADTTGLIVGQTYNDTLTISGAGIQQTELVALSLTVTAPASYRLTVTVLSDTAGKGGGAVNDGTGIIACNNTGNNPLTQIGTCSADLAPGASITLHQLADSNSTVATWSGDCVGSGDCGVTNIAANTAVTATFPYSFMAKDTNSGVVSDSLVTAYGAANTTDTINTRAVTFAEGPITFSGGKIITLYGGLDAYYQPQSGQFTTVQGPLKISSGRMSVKGVKVR